MISRSHRVNKRRHKPETELNIFMRQDARRRHRDDNLDNPRCPKCGSPLVLRQDCRGPYYFCLCPDERKAA